MEINKYQVGLRQDGAWEIINNSPMFPFSFEKKINSLAGENITGFGIEQPFISGFINSFCILKDKIDVFKRILPQIGHSCNKDEGLIIWNKDEEGYEI